MATFKRKVFYVSGFDPRGPRFYYQLYKEQAEKYAGLAGESIAVSERTSVSDDEVAWRIFNATQDVATDYSFLRWDDIVRKAWIRNPWALLWRSAKTYGAYFRHMQWRGVFKLPRAPVVTFFYPPASFILIPLALFLGGYFVLGGLVAKPLAALLSVLLAAGLSTIVLRHIKSPWLLRFFIFNYEVCAQDDPQFYRHLERFAKRIVQSFDEGYDEILLVSHSNGSILAVPLMNFVLKGAGGNVPSHFHLLTLGQCIPLVSYLGKAEHFRAQLAELSRQRFDWLDIGFPPDGACYALVNPFLPHHPGHATQIELVSARFFRYYTAETYRRLRRNKYQLHFQYLCCGDSLSPWNYLAITTGRAMLAARALEAREAA